jgi:D-beta-D-heptose 7-phosphate kinase / D-beta-D-heptose 1-phosphate adenosyltransferase
MINFEGNSPKLLVIGDLMIDHYLWGTCERISPEAPVQVVNINNESTLLGAAGNVINNLTAFGAQVDVISVIGDCETSKELKELLGKIHVDSKNLIIQKDRITSRKTRIVASQQQVVRYDRESTEEISSSSQKKVLAIFNSVISNYDNVLLSDYGKGVLTRDLTTSIITIANRHNKKVLVDPKGCDFSKYKGAYLLTPNKKEASEATLININDNESLSVAITQLKNEFDLEVSLITLSEQGVAIYDNDLRIHPTEAREVFDVTGAGDTVLASLGFAIACNYEIDEAVEFANLAAGAVVGKIGSATASLEEINEYEASLKKSIIDKNIKNINQIALISKELKSRGKKVIFTNGCFDILHAGHVRYLETAKSYGDILIVGLNSDRSVNALKGQNRPINSEIDRVYILAALEAVDYVFIFDEDTPYNLIKAVKPNILVKGGDYEGKEVIGQDIADELKLVEFIDEKSTSNTIKKIQNTKLKVK